MDNVQYAKWNSVRRNNTDQDGGVAFCVTGVII